MRNVHAVHLQDNHKYGPKNILCNIAASFEHIGYFFLQKVGRLLFWYHSNVSSLISFFVFVKNLALFFVKILLAQIF